MSRHKGNLILLAVLIFYVLKGIFYVFYIPPWEAPDEPGHAAYVIDLYVTKQLPNPTTKAKLIDLTLATSWDQQIKLLSKMNSGMQVKNKPLFNRNQLHKQIYWTNILGYPPLYYLYLLPSYLISLPLTSYWSFIFFRIGSLMLGLMSLIFIYKIIRLLFPRDILLPVLTIVFLVLDPQFTFMTAVVNNDNMALSCFTLFTYLTLRYIVLNGTITITNIIFVGLFGGLSTLSKPQMLFIIPVYLGYVAYIFLKKNIDLRRLVTACISTLLIPGIYYGLLYISYGSNAYNYAFKWSTGHPMPFWLYPFDFVKAKQLIGIFMSFWGFFGWLSAFLPKWMYMLIFLVMLAAGIGWVYAMKNKSFMHPQSVKGVIFTAAISLVYTSTIFMYDLMTFMQKGKFLIQGRYFLPVMSVVIFCIVYGLLMYKGKLRIIILSTSLGIFILSQILMYTTISSRYYNKYSIISPLTKIYLSSR